MQYAFLVVGLIWSLPITALGFLFHILPFWILGFYRFSRFKECAIIWEVDLDQLGQDRVSRLVRRIWRSYTGLTTGSCIIIRSLNKLSYKTKDRILQHQLQHCRQTMILGLFQPVFYFLCWIVIRISMPNNNPHYDNPLEIDARRAANQVVDMTAVLQKVKTTLKEKGYVN